MAKPKKQGQQPPPDDDDEDGGEGEGLTDAQRTEITNLVNAAVSGQLSRKLPNAITAAVETAIKPLRDQMGSRRRDDDEDGGEGDDIDEDEDQPPARGGKRNAAASKDPQYARMQRDLRKLQEERKVEREQARNRERDTLLREQLEAVGVDKNRMRGAVAILASSMKYDEKAGTWSYRTKRDGMDEDLDIDVGVGEWAATDEGKAFLAPPQQGSPQRGGSGHRPAMNTGGAAVPRLGRGGGAPAQDPKTAKVQARQAAMQNLSAAMNELGGASITVGGGSGGNGQ